MISCRPVPMFSVHSARLKVSESCDHSTIRPLTATVSFIRALLKEADLFLSIFRRVSPVITLDSDETSPDTVCAASSID